MNLDVVYHSMRRSLSTLRLLLESSLDGIRRKYAGSALGLAWALILPIGLLAVYSILYVAVLQIRISDVGPVQYVLMVCSGLAVILAFNEILGATSQSLRSNRDLLMNAVFPPRLLPLRDGLVAQTTGLIALTIVMIAGFVLGYASWVAIIMVPLAWLSLLLFALGIGTMLSLIGLVVRDIQNALTIIFLVTLAASPIAYVPGMVPPGLQFLIYLNPVSYFVLSVQSPIAFGQMPPLIVVAVALALGAFVFACSQLVFSRARQRFQDFL